MRTAVITLARGRHEHLRHQAAAVRAVAPEAYVVVAMADPEIGTIVPDAELVSIGLDRNALPLAAARNAGAARAIALGAELLVFLDVDCVPESGCVRRYAEVAEERDGLLCGPVGHLPPGPLPGDLRRASRVPSVRPLPGEAEVVRAASWELFWSLSFAVRAVTWARIGGFCEAYRGYGGEDTDFARAAHEAGVPLWWVGGAWAHHQHHEGGGVPFDRVEDVVRNATLFHDRWGTWPMTGWLRAFEERGLARFRDGRWRCVRSDLGGSEPLRADA
jgi:GT2 family glycosyltransferase